MDQDQLTESAGGNARTLYRMFAMYRHTGNVAVSFETGLGGGFVQVSWHPEDIRRMLDFIKKT